MKIIIAVLLSFFFINIANAAPTCGDRNTMTETLTNRHEETLVGQGISSNNQLVQLFVNEDTGTWTVLSILPNNHDIACIGSYGTDWVTLEEKSGIEAKFNLPH